MQKIISLLFIIGICILGLKCENLTGEQEPVISGTELITLTSPSNNAIMSISEAFQFEQPEDVSYVVVGVFASPIILTSNSSGGGGINPIASNLILGNRTGLSGYTNGRVLINALYPLNTSKSDFDTATGFSSLSTPITAFWVVWGVDEYGNLTHSSESRQFEIP